MKATLSALLLAATFATLPGFAQTTTTAPAPGPAWGSPSDGSSPVQELGLQVPERDSLVVMGRTGCPIVVAGHEVWDLAKQQRTPVTIPHSGASRSIAALSDDGTLLAVGPEEHVRRDEGDDVTIWSTQTGQKLASISAADRDRDLEYLGFAADQYLLISARANSARRPAMEIWDAHTGKFIRRFPCNFSGAGTTTISPDGRYVAILDNEHVYVYELATGAQVASMPQPTTPPDGVTPVPGSRRSRLGDSPVPFVSMDCLNFSPDGSQLAAGGSFGGLPYLCWNNKAQLTAHFLFTLNELDHRSERPYIQWSPDSSTWLVNQHWIFDPKNHRPLWMSPLAFADRPLTCFLDNDHLFMIHRVISDQTEVIRIPWDKIHQAIAAMSDPAKSLLGPGQRVSLDVQSLHCRGDQIDTIKLLTDAVTKRLAVLGVQVGDNEPTVVTVSLDEAAEAPRPVVTRGGPFDRTNRPTTRTASPAKGLLTFTIHPRAAADASAFTFTQAATSPFMISGTITDESLRTLVLRDLVFKLERITLPYFISRDSPPIQLPLGMAPPDAVSSQFLKDTEGDDKMPLVEMPDPFHPRTTPPEQNPSDNSRNAPQRM